MVGKIYLYKKKKKRRRKFEKKKLNLEVRIMSKIGKWVGHKKGREEAWTGFLYFLTSKNR